MPSTTCCPTQSTHRTSTGNLIYFYLHKWSPPDIVVRVYSELPLPPFVMSGFIEIWEEVKHIITPKVYWEEHYISPQARSMTHCLAEVSALHWAGTDSYTHARIPHMRKQHIPHSLLTHSYITHCRTSHSTALKKKKKNDWVWHFFYNNSLTYTLYYDMPKIFKQ